MFLGTWSLLTIIRIMCNQLKLIFIFISILKGMSRKSLTSPRSKQYRSIGDHGPSQLSRPKFIKHSPSVNSFGQAKVPEALKNMSGRNLNIHSVMQPIVPGKRNESDQNDQVRRNFQGRNQPIIKPPHLIEIDFSPKQGRDPMFLVLIGGIILAIILFACFFAWPPRTCAKEYQKMQCWREQNSQKEDCLSLESCIISQGQPDYSEYLMTLLAAAIVIYKKYRREMIIILERLKEFRIG